MATNHALICLWYERDAEAAARFYAETFPNSCPEVFASLDGSSRALAHLKRTRLGFRFGVIQPVSGT